MRYAILTDIHGNSLALDAVFADITAKGGVDQYLFLGDYCGIGYDPVGILERIASLPNANFVRGNVDRYVTRHQSPDPTIEDVHNNPQLAQVLAEVQRGFGWTSGAIMQASKSGEVDYWSWLRDLPLEHRLTLPDGTRILCVHAKPAHDDGDALYPEQTDDALREFQQGAEADLIFVGHTHIPHQRTVDGVHWCNPGSVGNPLNYPDTPTDVRACYAILDTGHDGYSITLHRVEYDVEAVIQAFHAWEYPSRVYPISFYEGKRLAGWL